MTDFKPRTMPHRICALPVRTIVGIADSWSGRQGAGAVATVEQFLIRAPRIRRRCASLNTIMRSRLCLLKTFFA